MAHPAYAELHCHSHFSFLDGASAPDDLVARAVELGLAGARHHGPPGPVRRGPLLDRRGGGGAAPGDRDRDRARRRGGAGPGAGSWCRRGAPGGRAAGRRWSTEPPRDRRRAARPAPPDPHPAAGPSRGREGGPPGNRRGAARAAPPAARPGRDGLAEPVPDGVAGEPRRDEGRAASSPRRCWRSTREGLIALSGCREGELARRLRAGDREGARAVAERYAALFGQGGGPAGESAVGSGFVLELSHHLLPDDDWLVVGDGAPGRGAGAAGGRDQRRPLRAARGPRAPGRPDRDPPRPVAARAARTSGGRTGSRTSRAPPSCSRCRRASPSTAAADPVLARALAGGDRGVGGDRRGVPGGARLRALPLPGLRRAEGRDAVQPPARRCAGRARGGATTR